MSVRVARLVQTNHPDLQQEFRDRLQALEYVAADRVLRVAVADRAKSDPALARALKLRRLAVGAIFVLGLPLVVVLFELLQR